MKDVAVSMSGSGLNLGFHQGVGEKLKEAGVRPSVILGTSGGSIIGAMWAMNKLLLSRGILLSLERPEDIYKGGIGRIAAGAESLNTWPGLRQLAIQHIRSEDFEIDFYAGVVFDNDGLWQMVSHKRSFIAESVLGSSAVIPWVAPIDLSNDDAMVDGGFFYPLGNLEAFHDVFSFSELIVVDATKAILSKPRRQPRTFLGNLERAVELLVHQVYLHNRLQIGRLRSRGVRVHLVEPAHSLGGGRSLVPGEMKKEIEHGHHRAAMFIKGYNK